MVGAALIGIVVAVPWWRYDAGATEGNARVGGSYWIGLFYDSVPEWVDPVPWTPRLYALVGCLATAGVCLALGRMLSRPVPPRRPAMVGLALAAAATGFFATIQTMNLMGDTFLDVHRPGASASSTSLDPFPTWIVACVLSLAAPVLVVVVARLTKPPALRQPTPREIGPPQFRRSP